MRPPRGFAEENQIIFHLSSQDSLPKNVDTEPRHTHTNSKRSESSRFTYPKAGSFLSAFLCILMRLIEVDLLFIGGWFVKVAVSRVKVYVFEKTSTSSSIDVRPFVLRLGWKQGAARLRRSSEGTHITRGPSASALTSDIVRLHR